MSTHQKQERAVQLIYQNIELGLSSFTIKWDRPYHATISIFNGEEFILPSKDGVVHFSSYDYASGPTGKRGHVDDNEIYEVDVILDEYIP